MCGAGVIRACTAHFLTQRGIDVTVMERTVVAAAASGKAGGFRSSPRSRHASERLSIGVQI